MHMRVYESGAAQVDKYDSNPGIIMIWILYYGLDGNSI